MQEILKWLKSCEDRAARIYEEGATALAKDAAFADFLAKLSRDEQTHARSMLKAGELLGPDAKVWSVIALDDETRESIDKRFDGIEKLLSTSTLTPEAMLSFIAEAECSEWNDLYLFVLNMVSRASREFIPYVVEIQRHKRRLENFLKERGCCRESLEKLKKLKNLWNEKILVVDDEPIILDVLRAILENEGQVDSATNGREALDMLSRNYYAVIISDIDMPVMDGMEFYEKASALYPGLADRFIFHTGSLNEKRRDFFVRHNKVACLQKPTDLRTIRNAINAVFEG